MTLFIVSIIVNIVVLTIGFFLGRRPVKVKPGATEVRRLLLSEEETLEAAKLYDLVDVTGPHAYATAVLWKYLSSLLPEHMRNESMRLDNESSRRRWVVEVTVPVDFPTAAEWFAKQQDVKPFILLKPTQS